MYVCMGGEEGQNTPCDAKFSEKFDTALGMTNTFNSNI